MTEKQNNITAKFTAPVLTQQHIKINGPKATLLKLHFCNVFFMTIEIILKFSTFFNLSNFNRYPIYIFFLFKHFTILKYQLKKGITSTNLKWEPRKKLKSSTIWMIIQT